MVCVCMASSKVATISSNVQRVTGRSCSLGNALATEMTCTRVEETMVRGLPERAASCKPDKPRATNRRRHLPTVRLVQPRSRPIWRFVGVSISAALKTIRARKLSDCGVEWARAKAYRSVRAFCDKMMRGAKGVGMGDLLAKRPSILIMSICSLYHIFYVGISDIACNEFTKRSTRSPSL